MKFHGSAGRYFVWHTGMHHYSVTEGRDGKPVITADSLGEAYRLAGLLFENDSIPETAVISGWVFYGFVRQSNGVWWGRVAHQIREMLLDVTTIEEARKAVKDAWTQAKVQA